jgi:excisionase family DNA binding protein
MTTESQEILSGWLTTTAVARVLRIGETYCRLLIAKGKIKSRKLGRQHFVSQREIERYVENMNVRQKAELWKKGRKF